MNRRIAWRPWGLSLMAVLLGALVLELVLRVATAPWSFLDPRTDAFWAARLRSMAATDAARRSDDVEYDPLLGWRMRRGYASAEANHDARGFRTHEATAPRPNPLRVLMIGDSFTYGFGVRDNETAAAQLEQLSGAEVINAGVNSFGADQAYLMWELEGRKESANIVVLGYHLDDFYRNLLSVREAPKPYLVRDDQTYRFGGIPVQSIETWAAAHGRGFHLRTLDVFGHVARYASRKLHRPDPLHEEAADRSRHILLALRDSVSASGAHLVVMLIPFCWQGDDFDAAWAIRSIREAGRIGKIPLVDFTEDNAAAEIYERCHWNALGHRMAATKLFSTLRESLLIKH